MVRVSTVSSRSRQKSPSIRTSTNRTGVNSLMLPIPSPADDCRTTSEHGRRATPPTGAPSIISSSLSPASRPSARRFMSTLDSGGRAASAITSQLSKPTMATSCGTARPRSRSASAAPRAIWSLPQKSASGGAARVEEPGDGLAAPGLRPDAGQVEAWQFRQPGGGQRRSPAGSAEADRLEVLRPGDVGDPPAAEPGQMLDREHRPALVVGQQAERAGIVGLGEDVDDRQSVRERSDRRPLVGAARGHHQPVDALAAAAGRGAGARAPDRRWRCT